MLVLMDMEWIENKLRYFCPTQISAMRVDDKWRCVDRFDARVRPFDKSCQQWNHVAFSGAEPEQFLAADAGPLVFMNLFRWLRPDDILCWWGEQPALVFRNVVGNVLHRNVDHSLRTIYPAWKKETSDGRNLVGSPYRLARIRNIAVPQTEHVSANDVDAIRALLYCTGTSQAAIRASCISPNAKIITQADYFRERAVKRAASSNPVQFKLFYDAGRELLHRADCPEILWHTGLQGFLTFRSCIQKKLKPCTCCEEEYRQENQRLKQEIIQKCRFNYIYERNGRTFHRADCIYTEEIPFTSLYGSIYYDNCIEKGLFPCEWCKPSREQQVEPPHIYPKNVSDKDQYANEWNATRKLTHNEKVALRRHEAAQKERTRLIMDKRIRTQTELHDEHILTQTGYAFWCAAGYQTFHLRNCTKLQHISDLHGFARFQDAIHAGLTPCRECRPTPKFDITVSVPIYQRERKDESVDVLDRLCDGQGYLHTYTQPDYYIETPVGKWRLDTASHPVDVYHINLVTGKGTALYHRQHRLFLSLTDTFEYIKRHERSLMEKCSAEESPSE